MYAYPILDFATIFLFGRFRLIKILMILIINKKGRRTIYYGFFSNVIIIFSIVGNTHSSESLKPMKPSTQLCFHLFKNFYITMHFLFQTLQYFHYFQVFLKGHFGNVYLIRGYQFLNFNSLREGLT